MRRTAIAVLALAFTAAACGGGGSEDISETSQRATVTASEFAFEPANLTVPGGAEVGFTLNNTGTQEHYWVVLESPVSSESEIGDAEELFEVEAHGGDTAAKILKDLAPGTYQVVCTVEGHFAAGMVGELVVTG